MTAKVFRLARRPVVPLRDQVPSTWRLYCDTPGFYLDLQGRLHFVAPIFLEHIGWPDTLENRERVCELAANMARERGVPATVVE